MSDPRAVIAQARELADVLATIPEKIRNRDEEEARTLLPALAAALEAALDRIAALEGAAGALYRRNISGDEYQAAHDRLRALLAPAEPAPACEVCNDTGRVPTGYEDGSKMPCDQCPPRRELAPASAPAEPAPVVTVPVRIGPESRLKLSPEMRAVIAADSKLPPAPASAPRNVKPGPALMRALDTLLPAQQPPACATCGGNRWIQAWPDRTEPCPACQPPGDGPRGGA